MMEKIISEIIAEATSTTGLKVFREFKLGIPEFRNELLLFVKPEVFMVNDNQKVEQTLGMIFDKLQEYNATSDGIALVGGMKLDEKEIMSRHYGFINQLSRNASRIISQQDRSLIESALDLQDSNYRILGGHEYLREHIGMSVDDMKRVWIPEKSIKLRSGFYIEAIENTNGKVVLVNGFHPQQLAHFTKENQRILLVLIHSNTDWAILRNHMIGSTFPNKAAAGSIRNLLYNDPEKFGFKNVTVENNGVHLSAGPFEGAFEIINFLGNLFEYNIENSQPTIIKNLVLKGQSLTKALSTINNPGIKVNNKLTDLFSATEDRDTEDAIRIWQESSSEDFYW